MLLGSILIWEFATSLCIGYNVFTNMLGNMPRESYLFKKSVIIDFSWGQHVNCFFRIRYMDNEKVKFQ